MSEAVVEERGLLPTDELFLSELIFKSLLQILRKNYFQLDNCRKFLTDYLLYTIYTTILESGAEFPTKRYNRNIANSETFHWSAHPPVLSPLDSLYGNI